MIAISLGAYTDSLSFDTGHRIAVAYGELGIVLIISRSHYLMILYQDGDTLLQPSTSVQGWKNLLCMVELKMLTMMKRFFLY